MNENQYFSYLDVGLPEAVEKMKLCGELEAAVDCIDQRLACTNLPENLRYCLLAEREMIRRMPADFPYTRTEAMDIIRAEIPSYTEEEFDAAVACGQIRFIYLHGEMRIFNRFFSSMCKSVPEFRDRTKVALNGGESSGRGSKGDLRLNRSMRIMKEQGALANRITIRATVKVEDAAFKPGMLVRVHVPIAAACEQQSDIRIESMFPENGQIAPEDAEQRTVYWEENMQENHEFSVTYSYVHTAKWHDVETVLHGMPMSQGTMQDAGSACCEAAQRPSGVPELPCLKPEALAEYVKDTAELAPHIEFTPYIRALTEACAQGCTTPLEKAKSFYDFITKNFRYTYMPAYFTLDSIAENCARVASPVTVVSSPCSSSRCAAAPVSRPSGRAALQPSRNSSADTTGHASTPSHSDGSSQTRPSASVPVGMKTKSAASSTSVTSTRTAWLPTAPSRHHSPWTSATSVPTRTITSTVRSRRKTAACDMTSIRGKQKS